MHAVAHRPELIEAAQGNEGRAVIDFREACAHQGADLEDGGERGLPLLGAFGHRGRPDLNLIADLHTQGAGQAKTQNHAAIV